MGVTMSGGKKKSKGVSMPLDAFLSAEDSWADVEDDYAPTEEAPRESYDDRRPPSPREEMPRRRGDRHGNRYDAAPRREARPQLPVPERPPFIAFVGNLSFSATEDDIGDFFAEHCAVESVRLIRDVSTNRSKGFGYVTFADRESLITALDANEVEVCGRPIHVDVAEGRQSEDRRGGPSRADMADTWERGKSVPANERPLRTSSGGRDRGGRERGGFGSGRGGRDRDFGEERRERKPLNLKPRSEQSPADAGAPAKKGSNPFGDAKPRDEAKFQQMQREREAERKQAAEARKAEPRGSGSDRGGRGRDSGAERGGKRGGFRNRHESSEGRDFSQARSNMGKKPAPSPKSDEKKSKQSKPQTVQKESASIPVGNIFSALKNQEA